MIDFRKYLPSQLALIVSAACAMPSMGYPAERLISTSVNTRAEYNDNIFLSSSSIQNRSAISVVPSIRYSYITESWNTGVQTKARLIRYSEDQLDSNDVFFSGNFTFSDERSTYAVNTGYDLNSNLDTESVDFAVIQTRVNREALTISPRYSYSLSRQLLLNLSGTFTEVDYDAGSSGFVPYSTTTGRVSMTYGTSSITNYRFTVQRTSYVSKDKLSSYDLNNFKLGVKHNYKALVGIDFSLGYSDRTSVSAGAPINFLGLLITPLGIETSSSSLVYNFYLRAALTQTSNLGIRLRRFDETNSFGGLNEETSYTATYDQDLTARWRWDMRLGSIAIKSQTAGIAFADRQRYTAQATITHDLEPNLALTGSLRYLTRKFTNGTTSNVPASSRVYIELRYKFKDL